MKFVILVWAVSLCSILSQSGSGKEPEEALVDFASHVDGLDEMAVGLEIVGGSEDRGGPRNLGPTEYRVIYVQDSSGAAAYRHWGVYGGTVSFSDLNTGESSTMPAVFEWKRFLRSDKHYFSSYRMSHGWGTNSPQSIEDKEGNHPAIMPKGNWGLLGLIPDPTFSIEAQTCARTVGRLLDMELLESNAIDSKKIRGKWILMPAKRATMEIVFDRDAAWMPVQIEMNFIDKKSTPTGKLWTCALEWQKVGARMLQKRTTEENYFPNGLIKKYDFEYRWTLENETAKINMAALDAAGINPRSDELVPSTNWREAAAAVLEGKGLLRSVADDTEAGR